MKLSLVNECPLFFYIYVHHLIHYSCLVLLRCISMAYLLLVISFTTLLDGHRSFVQVPFISISTVAMATST